MSYQIEKDWMTSSGFRAIVITTSMGHRCGYVAVPNGHPLYKVGYGDKTTALQTIQKEEQIGKRGPIAIMLIACKGIEESNYPEAVFDVHGSITYAGEKYPVPDENLWWFGFDAAHCNDNKEIGGQIHEYMVNECESLAKQIKEKVQTYDMG